MNGTGSEQGRPVEDRLRRAFAARAATVDVRDLRPAEPPGPHLRRRTALARPWLRRFGLPLAAAAAVALGYLTLAPEDPPVRPAPRPAPAAPPTPVGPTPSPTTPPTGSPSAAPTRRPSATPTHPRPHRTAGTPSPGSPSPDLPPDPEETGGAPTAAPSSTPRTPTGSPSGSPSPTGLPR
ncbi:hypothetical protein [Streptomyces sp. NPDC101150]|uniref:hypothetical protein n=1 Tax=Streptomyces sp. NPDC101150 TaxID=3366114 RepID=UPI0038089D45